jgi:hypothetical protein
MPGDHSDGMSKEDFHAWLLDHSDEAVDELDVGYRSLKGWVVLYCHEVRRMQAEEDGSEQIYEESELSEGAEHG